MTYPLGTLNLSDIQKTIYSWVKQIVKSEIPGDQILWRNQSEPLPPRPCVSMKITEGPRRVGFQDSAVFIGGPTGSQFMIGGQREMTVSFQVFGNTRIHRPMAYELAIDLNSSLSLMTILNQLGTAGVSVLKQGSVSNITFLEETEYEERAQFDVLFGLAQNIVDDPGIIQYVGPVGSTYLPP